MAMAEWQVWQVLSQFMENLFLMFLWLSNLKMPAICHKTA
jgi:hypothetical protein